jgi:hypothetical protein
VKFLKPKTHEGLKTEIPSRLSMWETIVSWRRRFEKRKLQEKTKE